VLREPGRPAVGLHGDARQGTPLCRRRLHHTEPKDARARVQAKKGQPVKGVDAKPGTVWVKPGLKGRVRHMKDEEKLRHATLQEVSED
jgi:bifunctional non-homologous end joining protein LigD